MKKAFIYIVFAFFAASSIAHAELALLKTQNKASTPTTKATLQATATTTTSSAPETVATRKAHAETSLRALQAQFGLFITRTQATIDRLTLKGVDTTKAQASLTASKTSLDSATANLDLFAKIEVTDETSEADTSDLKVALKKIEDALKETRAHLIQSLTELKTSVSLTIEAQ